MSNSIRNKLTPTKCQAKKLPKQHNSCEELFTNSERKKCLTREESPFKPRKYKTPAENACNTPSSLYRNALTNYRTINTTPVKSLFQKSTPGKLRTCLAKGTEDRLVVAVRIRPLTTSESTSNVVKVSENQVVVSVVTPGTSSSTNHTFAYDHVFNSCDPNSIDYVTQNQLYEKLACPLLDKAFEGYNACLFAYGQTGSGKSYSMMGSDPFSRDNFNQSVLGCEAGIIPRFCYQLFRYLELHRKELQIEIEVSYFEIYNEKIHDLLCVRHEDNSQKNIAESGGIPAKNPRKCLKVREHPIWGPYVAELSVHSVDTCEALQHWLILGNSQRATAATGLNEKSSRSHSILNIMLNVTDAEPSESSNVHQVRRSKISLVDLAGSERVNGTNDVHKREGVHINKSLLALGKVIAALADEKNRTTFVPYRESVLTYLLRENLGGNSKTVMLATISPAKRHIDETLATLRYACQARRIVNRVKINESENDKIIRELRAEIDRLKLLQNEYQPKENTETPNKVISSASENCENEIENLREQLIEREKELCRFQKSWMERLEEAENLRKSELQLLKRKGLALELTKNSNQAYLVNLSEDPMLSETLFYILPLGSVTIGRTRFSLQESQPDIVLDGPLIAHNHCTIENDGGRLYIIPEIEHFETYLNGELVKNKTECFHGDRLILGGSHYFRVSNPFFPATKGLKQVIDYHLAYKEVLEKQEEKLRLQLEDEKQMAIQNMEKERSENERNYKELIEKLELERILLKCHEEILESERKTNINQSIQNDGGTPNEVMSSPTSNNQRFLDEINDIMQKPSRQNLHKVQLLVRINKVVDEFGLLFQTKILIIDKQQQLVAEWPLARLDVWLDIIRNLEDVNNDNCFNSVDIEWKPLEADLNESLNNSINSSGIAIDLKAYKDNFLKKSPIKQYNNVKINTETAKLSEVNGKEFAYGKNVDFSVLSAAYINEMKQTAINLRKLCQRHLKDASLHEMVSSLDSLENTLKLMQTSASKSS
uniref:Kinesin motor domain-containing protein n=1 Tax=Glossina brevipalpis TaxID=37001 RepID=A0A1A9WEY2_9MUSC